MLSEKLVFLARAIVAFSVVFITRFFYKISPQFLVYFDAVLAIFLIFVLISLFYFSENVVLQIGYHFVDILFVSFIVRYSGGVSSPFIILYLPIVAYLTYVFGREVGAGSLLFVGISSYLLIFQKEMIFTSYFIIMLMLVISYLLVWIIKDEITIKNYISQLQNIKNKLASHQQTIQHLHHRISEEQVIDPITELYNMKYFLMRLEEEMPKAKRHKFPFSIIVIGVDNFRAFNSRYGEKRGNEALRIIATLLKVYFRHSDLLCRQDGTDKFVLFLPYTEGWATRVPLERFRDAVYKYRFDEKDASVSITISAGIASFPQDGDSERVILEKAEGALRRAKLAGKDRIFFASEPKE